MAVPQDIEQRIQKARSLGVPPEVIMQRVQRDYPDYKPVSSLPSTTGQFIGSIAGSPLGPIGRSLGASVGGGIGEEVAQRQAGRPGDPGAFLPFLGPPGMLLRTLQKGPTAEDYQTLARGDIGSLEKRVQERKSSTERAIGRGATTQLTGESIAGLFNILKPGVINTFLNKITERFSPAGGKTIFREVIKTRFFNETLPKALQSSGTASEAEIIGTGEKIMGERLVARILDPKEINYVRKQFNALGKGQMDSNLVKFLSNDLARILREEQFKLAPATQYTIPAQQAVESVPSFIKEIPLIGGLLSKGGKALQGATSATGGFLSRYILPSFLKEASEER